MKNSNSNSNLDSNSNSNSNSNLDSNLNNKPKYNWLYFSFGTFIISLITIIALNKFLIISFSLIKILGLIFTILSLIFLFLSSRLTVYKHNFLIHPSSFISQKFVFNKSNIKAVKMFTGFPIFVTLLFFLLGNLISSSYSHLKYFRLIVIAAFFGSLSFIWIVSVQLDISRFGHLAGVAGLFISFLSLNILILMLLLNFQKIGIIFPPFYYITSIIQITSATLYLISYIYDLFKQPPLLLKPGLHQIIWLIISISSIFILIHLFSSKSFYFQTFFD